MRAMAVAFLLQAVCLMFVLTFGRNSGALFTISLVCVYLTWGEVFSLFPSLVAVIVAVPGATGPSPVTSPLLRQWDT